MMGQRDDIEIGISKVLNLIQIANLRCLKDHGELLPAYMLRFLVAARSFWIPRWQMLLSMEQIDIMSTRISMRLIGAQVCCCTTIA